MGVLFESAQRVDMEIFEEGLGSTIKDIVNKITDKIKTGYKNLTSVSYEKLHVRLLNIVDNLKTQEDIDYMIHDLSLSKPYLKNLIAKEKEAGDLERVKAIQDHIKWLDSVYIKALRKKEKDIKSKKSVKEDYMFI